jgi:hypothetical protein
VRDDVTQPGAREPAFTEQPRCAAYHAPPDLGPWMLCFAPYDGQHIPAGPSGATVHAGGPRAD